MPTDWTPKKKKQDDELINMLTPYLDESMKYDQNRQWNGPNSPPINTQIRNYVPNPGQIGDFKFGNTTDYDLLKYLYFLKNKTTRL